MLLAVAVLAAAATAVALAACGLEHASEHIHQGHGHDAECHNCLYNR